MIKKTRLYLQTRSITAGIDDRHCRRHIDRLLRMEDSTTAFLEQLAGRKLLVKTEFQKEMHTQEELEIVRVVRLYFDTPEDPVIYSITSIPRKNLAPPEVEQLKAGRVPLGAILGAKAFRKRGITVKQLDDRRMVRKLNSRNGTTVCFEKEYCLWVKDRRIGMVKEIFSHESFLRVWGRS